MSQSITKCCSKCNLVRSISDFYKRSDANGYKSECKKCSSKRSRKWEVENRDKKNLRSRNRGKSSEERRRSSLMSKFKMTEVDYNKIYNQQNGKCAICGSASYGKAGATKLAVDHCHKTGKIRGLLCFNCNTMLGKVKDSIETLESAIIYLKKHTDT